MHVLSRAPRGVTVLIVHEVEWAGGFWMGEKLVAPTENRTTIPRSCRSYSALSID
jgi:hypothetical protein